MITGRSRASAPHRSNTASGRIQSRAAHQHDRHHHQQPTVRVVAELAQDPPGGGQRRRPVHAAPSPGPSTSERGTRPPRSPCRSVRAAPPACRRPAAGRPGSAAAVAAGGLVHDVARDQQRGAAGRQLAEEVPQVPARHRIEADRRLVEHQQLGLASSAVASDTRDRCPPDSGRTSWSACSPRSTSSTTRSTAPAGAQDAGEVARLSRTVRSPYTDGAWVT